MDQQNGLKSRKKKSFTAVKVSIAAVFVLIVLAAILTGVYMKIGKKYESVFFPNTMINGIDVSEKNVDEVKQLIASGIDGYILTIEGRAQKNEVITKDQIGLVSTFDGSLESMISEQNPKRWWGHRNKVSTYEIETMIQFDQEKFQKVLEGLTFFDEELVTKPKDAELSGYVSGQGYTIVPAVQGDELIVETVKQGVSDAIMNMAEKVSLEELGAYRIPAIGDQDESLAVLKDQLNRYVNTKVTYTFGDKKELLTGDTISQWLSIGDDNQVLLDTNSVKAYVKELAGKYDTYGKPKTLKTSYSKTIKISEGAYGWKINQDAEAEALGGIIRSGESQTREPIYSKKAESHGAQDYGDTYVEINLTAQHLFFYKDGKLVVESDFVSGNLSKGYDTPAGVFPLTYKQRDAVLKGEDYRTPVDYWMPFNGGIGLHDAKWRSSFGGQIYKTGGSHGCINLPHNVAKTIFENLPNYTPVLCYFLEGSESKKASSGKPQETTPAPPETTEAVKPTKPAAEPATEATKPVPPATLPPESSAPVPETVPETETKPAEKPPSKPSGTTPAGPGADSTKESDQEIGPGLK